MNKRDKKLEEYTRIMQKPSILENSSPAELSELYEHASRNPDQYTHEELNDIIRVMRKRNAEVRQVEPLISKARKSHAQLYEKLKDNYDMNPDDLSVESLEKLRRGMEAGYIDSSKIDEVYNLVDKKGREELPDFFEQIIAGIDPDDAYNKEMNEYLNKIKGKHIEKINLIPFDTDTSTKGLMEQGRRTASIKDSAKAAAKGLPESSFIPDTDSDKRVTDELLKKFREGASEMSEDPIKKLTKASVGKKMLGKAASTGLKGLAGLGGFLFDSEALGAEEGTPEYNLETYGTEELPENIRQENEEKERKKQLMIDSLNKFNSQYQK